MARVTVEDCVEKVSNRFELVAIAAHRSREISAGGEPLVERDNDKNPVIALREIADEKVVTDELLESVVQSMQRHIEIDEPEEDGFDAIADNSGMAGEQEYTDEVAAAAGMSIEGADEADPHPAVSYEDVTSEDIASVQKE